MHRMLSSFRNYAAVSSKKRRLILQGAAFMFSLFAAAMAQALPLESVTSRECVRGD